MGIFNENMLRNLIQENDEIRESLSENCSILGTVGFSGELLETNMQLESLMHRLDEYNDMIETESITENMIDDYRDILKSTVTLITKGRDAMVKESTEAAKDASDYKNELQNIISSDKIIKNKLFNLVEYRTETVHTGNGSITTYYYKNPTFSNLVMPFNDILRVLKTRDKKAISDLKKKYQNICFDIVKWTPTIVHENVKSNIEKVLKILILKIESNKKNLTEFEKGTAAMKKSLEDGQSMIKSLSGDSDSDSKNVIKDLSKFINFQKSLYTHDMKLMHTNNLMILKQSREIKKIISKYKEK